MLRCSAATAAALPHLPVSLACFGSGLFNELGKHMTNWRQREREGEGGRKGGERECVWRQSQVSHTSEAVSTKTVQAASTPQQLLLLQQSRDAVQNRTTQQQQSPATGGSAVTQARRGLGLICICCCSWWWWWWHTDRSRLRCSTKQCEVDPCSRCATRTSWKKGCVHGSV